MYQLQPKRSTLAKRPYNPALSHKRAGMHLAGLGELRGVLIRVVKSRAVQETTERGAQIIRMYIEHRSDRVTQQCAAFHGASSNPANLSVQLKRFL